MCWVGGENSKKKAVDIICIQNMYSTMYSTVVYCTVRTCIIKYSGFTKSGVRFSYSKLNKTFSKPEKSRLRNVCEGWPLSIFFALTKSLFSLFHAHVYCMQKIAFKIRKA